MPRLVILPLKLEIAELPEGPSITLEELLVRIPQLGQPASSPAVAEHGRPEPAQNPLNYQVTQRIGQQLTPYNNKPHAGVDFAMPDGQGVAALRHGVVTFAGWADALSGNLVSIRYDDGVYAHFGHLSSVGATTVDSEVYPGTTIGFVGATGAATGPHLHLELHSGPGNLGELVGVIDPVTYFTA